MLTPTKLDTLPSSMIDIMAKLEQQIIKDIVRRVVKANYLTPTAEWQLYKANQLRMSSADINRIIARSLKKRERAVKELYTDAVKEAINEDAKIYRMAIAQGLLSEDKAAKLTSYFRSVALSNAFKQGLKNTNGLMRNLCNSTAAAANKTLSDVLDLAYLKTMSGAFTYQQAIYDAVVSLSNDGIKTVNYASGRTDQVDVAARRAILTGINKTACDMQLDLAKEMDSDLVEVSSHLGARPSHAQWQGKIYSISGKSKKYPAFYPSTGYGTGAGLGGWNCRHSFFPYFKGLSQPANAPDFSKSENLKEYSENQQQRAYERAIRKSKRELAALDEARQNAPDTETRAKLDRQFERRAVTLKNREARLKEFLSVTGKLPDNSRVRVVGFGKSVSQKVVHTVKAQLLPNYEKAVIPDEKLTGYALNLNHPTGKHKAIAFQNYLGYNISNKDLLVEQVRKKLKITPAKLRAETKHGQPFEVAMIIDGVDNKQAKVKTGWIIDKGADIPRLVSIYVDE